MHLLYFTVIGLEHECHYGELVFCFSQDKQYQRRTAGRWFSTSTTSIKLVDISYRCNEVFVTSYYACTYLI